MISNYFSNVVDTAFCWYLIALPPPLPTNSTVSGKISAIKVEDGVELKSKPVQSPFMTEIDEERGTKTSHQYQPSNLAETTWIYHLQYHKKLYEFAVWTAIVYPMPPTDATTPSTYTISQIRWKQRWVIFCHFCSLAQVVTTVATVISASIMSPPTAGNAVVIDMSIALSTIADCLPIIAIMPAIFILKRSITQSLCKPNHHQDSSNAVDTSLIGSISTSTCSENQLTHLSAVIIESIINHALSICKVIFIPLAIAPLLWGFIQIIIDAVEYGALIASYAIPIMFTAWTMIPPTAMLIGILTFLVMDQRYSYYMLLEMRQKALSNEVIDTVYLSIGKRLEERDANSPLNFMVGVAIVTILLCSIDLIYVNSNEDLSISEHITTSIILVYYASKVVAVLLAILYYMREVNDMADQLLHQVERRGSTDVIDEKLRVRRLELLSMMHGYRIGSTVFYQRPSTTQLMVQFLSLVVAVLTAVGKIVFSSIS